MSDDAIALARLIDALRPWRERIVLVGGWAHRLHRLHPHAALPSYQPIITRDVDLAFDARLKMSGDIAGALKDAGFAEQLSSDHIPPISHYTMGDEDQGFYAEFLTPLKGSGVRRDGTEDATTSVAGVSAQNLRHLEVLLVAPWRLELAPSDSIPIVEGTTLLVTNPVSYMAQKLLIHADRHGNKRAQDILYLNDTLELFQERLDLLRECWLNEVRPTVTVKQLRTMKDTIQSAFGGVTNSIREAARIPAGRRVTAEEIRGRCSVGLTTVFS